jgi:hypothetical protein
MISASTLKTVSLGVLACAWACSVSSRHEQVTTSDASSTAEDASVRDANEPHDASERLDASTPRTCGDVTCGADEVCVVPACGCRGLDVLADGGCPAKFSLAQDGTCAANCPFYPPYCWRPDGGVLLCEKDGGSFTTISGPVTASTSHSCNEICPP